MTEYWLTVITVANAGAIVYASIQVTRAKRQLKHVHELIANQTIMWTMHAKWSGFLETLQQAQANGQALPESGLDDLDSLTKNYNDSQSGTQNGTDE